MTSFFSFTLFFWQCWVFIAAWGLSPVADRGDCSLVAVHGFSSQWLLSLQSTCYRVSSLSGCSSQTLECVGFSNCGTWARYLHLMGCRAAGSVVVAHGPSCPAACGIFLDQELNPCPLHWQADFQPLDHQGSPMTRFLAKVKYKRIEEKKTSHITPCVSVMCMCTRSWYKMCFSLWVVVKIFEATAP